METLLALRWYLALQVFGLAALPLTLRLLRNLPGSGYAFARPLGLLLGGWAYWMLLVIAGGHVPNSAVSVLAALVLLAVCGVLLWRRSPVKLRDGLPKWTHVLAVELVLLAAFAGWCVVRAHMPRIETAGGEKWMEIAFLNAILRAPQFPPPDPWLSGFTISYYYFGYVMTAMLVHLSGVPSTIGFNLGIAGLFALTCTGAYGLVYSLLKADGLRGALWGGLLGPLLVALTGNLEGLLEVLHARGIFPASFWAWLDVRSINGPPPAFSAGSWTPTRFFWWWQASRVLHDYALSASPVDQEVIDEFPAFSFILGDMHPHVLGLPFVLLALALALAILLRPADAGKQRVWETVKSQFKALVKGESTSKIGSRLSGSLRGLLGVELPLSTWELVVYALCLGGIGFLNTWDFPIYLFVVVAAFVLAYAGSRLLIGRAAILGGLLAVGGVVLYLPFWLNLHSQASGILPNLFNPTRIPLFLAMFLPLLFPVAALVILQARRQQLRWWNVADWTLTIVITLLAMLLIAVLVSPVGRQYLTAWRSGGPIPGLESVADARQVVLDRLLDRLRSPWTMLILAGLLAGIVASVSRILKPAPANAPPAPPVSNTARYAMLLVAVGILLTLAVEFVYLKDQFGMRMNTVFKFYFQAWVVWGIAGAYGLARLLLGVEGRKSGAILGTVGLLLVAAGLVYPALAIPARARESGGEATLDGAAYLHRDQAADFAAIDWLNENAADDPVVLEAPGDRYRSYVYEARVSAFTGLPTLLGWGGHESQWRGNYDEPGIREPDIETLYSTTDLQSALTLLDRYGITYVYVGSLEQSRYPAEGLAKFAEMLETVYSANGVSIYRHSD